MRNKQEYRHLPHLLPKFASARLTQEHQQQSIRGFSRPVCILWEFLSARDLRHTVLTELDTLNNRKVFLSVAQKPMMPVKFLNTKYLFCFVLFTLVNAVFADPAQGETFYREVFVRIPEAT
ncbi:MAG TPA: hypothetical protein PLP17_12325, partial [Oligoflexia bacterium]|nr:hypothetical protein [Oligoflexia bacterium]